jgi:hypothetical protein
LPPESDWKQVYLIVPRRSCATGTQIAGPAMRRRHKRRWQYRELSQEEESKLFFQCYGSAEAGFYSRGRQRRSRG